jgi:hypothetical protein
MSGRVWLAAGGVALALVVAFFAWPKKKLTPEQLIEQHCVQLVRSAEERDVAAMMERISEKFRSPDGWTRQEVKQFLVGQLLRESWVRIFMSDLVVELAAPDKAVARGKFVFGRSDATSLKELAKDSVMSAYQLELEFTREGDGEWRVTREQHRRLAPEELLTAP